MWPFPAEKAEFRTQEEEIFINRVFHEIPDHMPGRKVGGD